MFKKLTIAFLAAMACVHAQEKDITEIDPNFRQATVGNREVRFADVRKAPFVLTGFAFRKSEDEPFYRIPTEFTKEQVNGGVLSLAKHPSGGAVLFRGKCSTVSPFFPASGAIHTPQMPYCETRGEEKKMWGSPPRHTPRVAPRTFYTRQ